MRTVLDRGRPLAAFESGGPRAEDFDRFMTAQRVRGVLVLHDGKIRLERYVSPHSPNDALELLFRGEIDHVNAGRRRDQGWLHP